MRGDPALLDAVIQIPGMPVSRLSVLINLRRAMDEHGVTRFSRLYPNSIGGITGGRATFRDTNGKGNTILTCASSIRSYVYGKYYDEIDISRSHISMVFGCWTLTGRRRPVTLLRFLSEQTHLETDLTRELTGARSRLMTEHTDALDLAQGVPTQPQLRRVTLASLAVEKSHTPPKKLYSAIINAPSPNAWLIPFSDCPTVCLLVNDICLMRATVPLHPLCTQYASALRQANTKDSRILSLCLGHLDDQALQAAAASLA